MSDARAGGKKKPARARRRSAEVDPIERDFGPGEAAEPPPPEPEEPAPSPATGPIRGLACGGDDCLLKPAADLVGRFTLSLAGRAALGRVAFSGIELLKALRDFLDEEIALAERAAGKGDDASQRYERIKVE